MADEETDLLIAGGGPAGMMAGLLFARAGVRTLVVEKHEDFLRDFRGDTVHPSTMQIFHELGMLDELLARPHDKARHLSGIIGGEKVRIADFSRPQGGGAVHRPDAAMGVPRLRRRSRPALSLLHAQDEGGGGRPGSRRRSRGRAARRREWQPADDPQPPRPRCRRPRAHCFARPRRCRSRISARRWTSSGSGCRRRARPTTGRTGVIATGRMLALIDRGDYWQCAYVFPKGSAEALRARGLENFREDVARTAPFLAAFGRRARELGSGQIAVGGARPADPLASSGPARDRRRRPRHVADRRGRHQPRDPGCGRGGEHPRRTDGRGKGCQRPAGPGPAAPDAADPDRPGHAAYRPEPGDRPHRPAQRPDHTAAAADPADAALSRCFSGSRHASSASASGPSTSVRRTRAVPALP